MKKCPICDLNYIQDIEEMCEVCRQERGLPGGAYKGNTGSVQIPQAPRYNGIGVFFVFQNEMMFTYEAIKKFIWAPFESYGKEPHHWQRLKYVKKGDIIIHGVNGCIRAISIATSNCYEDKNLFYPNHNSGRKVDCEYFYLSRPLVMASYKRAIITCCENKTYQPFNKNGTGNQGYLFDIDKRLATIFLNEICKSNPKISQLGAIRTFLDIV